MSDVRISTFYKFVALPDHVELRSRLIPVCRAAGIRGTILLAEEGINATIAGSESGVDTVLTRLRADDRLADLKTRDSTSDHMPFQRLKVRVKKEIVTMGVGSVDARADAGTYVAPSDWNRLISDPDVLVVDTRNSFEYGVGTFEGAVDPDTKSFRDFPSYVDEQLDPACHRRVAMFCTGGIRCEKATSYLRMKGFDEVYHLEGGILRYLEEIPKESSLWRGDCFVFDERIAVNHDLDPEPYVLCSDCDVPVREGAACACGIPKTPALIEEDGR